MPSTDVQKVIQELVDRWLASPSNDPELAEAVRKSGALPIYADMGGTLFLRPDGEILALDHDSPDTPQIEDDPSWKITAVVVGAEKYPELGPLLPARPSGAANCPECEGRGSFRFRNIDRDLLCGKCHGLGWLGTTVPRMPGQDHPLWDRELDG
jgi:hypothetical protein